MPKTYEQGRQSENKYHMTTVFHTKKNVRGSRGFVALFLVVLIGAAALILAYNSAFLGLGELDSGFSAGEGQAARIFADGCVEETLERIRQDANYGIGQGDILLSASGGSCIIRIENPGGNIRNILVEGMIGDYTRRIEADVSVAAEVIAIMRWEEN